VACVAYALWEKYQRESPFSFNRKEIKSYGEGGNIIGAPLKGKILIIDDVISAGTTFRETVQLLQSYPVQIAAVVTAMDRQERGTTQLSATQEIEQIYHVKSINIVKLADLIQYLSNKPNMSLELERMRKYQKEYGVNSNSR
jgi:orotate phosphoribosyltransferase